MLWGLTVSDYINQQKIYQNKSIAYTSKIVKAVNERQQEKLKISSAMPNYSDNVSFKATEKSSVLQKDGLSTNAKLGIGLGIVTLIGLGAELIIGKGKHIKSLWQKIVEKSPISSTQKPNTGIPEIKDFKNLEEAKEYFERIGIKTIFKDGSEKHLADLNNIKKDLVLLDKNGVAIPKPNSIILCDWHNVDESKQIFRTLNIDERNADSCKTLVGYWGTISKSTDNKCHVIINSSFSGNYGKFIHEMGHIHQDSFRTSYWHSKGLSDREFINKQLDVLGLSDIGIADDGIDMIIRESGNEYTPAIFRHVYYSNVSPEVKTKLKNLFPSIKNDDDYLKLFSIFGKDRKTYVINAKKMADKMYSESRVYAPEKIWENVAEIFEGLNKGKEYSDLVMLMYDINGGGRVPNLVIKGKKYDDYIASLYNNKDLIAELRKCIEIKEFV